MSVSDSVGFVPVLVGCRPVHCRIIVGIVGFVPVLAGSRGG